MSKKSVISAAEIKALRYGDKDLSDGRENIGLRVSCGKSGRKTFYYRYTSPLNGKMTQVIIGHFPRLTLTDARVELQRLKAIRHSGRCPAAEFREHKHRVLIEKLEANGEIFTVKGLVDLYLKQYIEDRVVGEKTVAGARKKKGQSEVRRTLYGDAVRVLGHKPAHEVTRKDVVNMVMEIVDRGASVQAGNVLRELLAAYDFGIGLEKFEEGFSNPAAVAKTSLKQAKIKLTSSQGKRVLTDKELKTFLEWLPGSAFTPTIKNVLWLTLLTGCRTGEICGAAWKEVDFEKGTLFLGETKTEAARYVQLPVQAVDLLRQLKLTTGKYICPSQKTGLPIQQKSMTEQSWQLRTTGRMLDIDHWTPHDLRRTVRTGLSRLGCPAVVGKAILGHAREGVEGTYDLHLYEAECKVWLQKWADHMDQLIGDDESRIEKIPSQVTSILRPRHHSSK